MTIVKNVIREVRKSRMKIIIEVGSTCTKIDKVENGKIEHLETVTILFKKHYLEKKQFNNQDVQILIEKVNQMKRMTSAIYVCGTSIFRTLEPKEKQMFLAEFQEKTGVPFEIISQDKENELTVIGATRYVNQKVAVFVGGGGSTEIAIYDKKMIEMANSPIGVVDVINVFPDLVEDIATSKLEEVKAYVKERVQIPKQKADILILAGGGHEHFARNSGLQYTKNTLFSDEREPIMMDIETRKKDALRYYQEISLEEIRRKVNDPDWWYATRAMVAFVLVVAEAMDAKYIVPTDISMVHGLLI